MTLKIYWHETPDQQKNFTSKICRWWFEKHGGQNVFAPQDADLIAASICSPRQVGLLAAGRKIADQRRIPFLVGGPETYVGGTYLAWADFLCVGEGYGLLASLAQNGLAALRVNSVLCRENPDAQICPDYRVPWKELPAIQTAARAYYYLAGRGCRRKCKFCYTSWTQPHQICPDYFLRATEGRMPRGAHIIYVTNDDGRLARQSGSATITEFLKPENILWPKVVRMGIEGVTQNRRGQLGKPISDAQIAQAIQKAKALGRQIEFFFIIGWPDDPSEETAFQELTDMLSVETIRHPRIYLKFTWFEAAPHTPLADYDLRQLRPWNYERASTALRAISGRYRIFRAGRPGLAIWCAILRRLPPVLAALWASQKSKCEKISDFESACRLAQSVVGEEFLRGSKQSPWHNILCKRQLLGEDPS